jgi:hypothetical protein
MFAGPDGVRVVPVQPFLSALSQKRACFDSIARCVAELVSFMETRMDERYVLAKDNLTMTFQREDADLVEAPLDSTG